MRPYYIFIILVCYVLLQFIWWSYLLIDLNDEVIEHKIENVYFKNPDLHTAKAEHQHLVNKQHQRRWMVVGEGLVFLAILGWGSIQTLRSFRREMQLARMQKNFLLSVTHEFKSPLASIKLYLQTILKHPLDREKEISFINKAIADTERLDALLENTLLANRVDYDGYFFNKEEFNFSAFTR
jgi:two-component system, OmpR family, phosphate regulon sensor histidine kinase PhoR